MNVIKYSLGLFAAIGLLFSGMVSAATVAPTSLGVATLTQVAGSELKGATTGAIVDATNKENNVIPEGTYSLYEMTLEGAAGGVTDSGYYIFDQTIEAVVWKTNMLDRAESSMYFNLGDIFTHGLELLGTATDDTFEFASFSGDTLTWTLNAFVNKADQLLILTQPVPVPAALPLFASALGLFGVFNYRRKKAQLAA